MRRGMKRLSLAVTLTAAATAGAWAGGNQPDGGPGAPSAGSYFYASASQTVPAPSAAQARALQYLSLYARVSVYAMYCDPQNRSGFNSAARALGVRTQARWSEAERQLGGASSTESIFERMRNDESYRFAVWDVEPFCASANGAFLRLARLASDAFAYEAARIVVR